MGPNVIILRTDSGSEDFKTLVDFLNKELAERDGDDHAFYDQFNSIENLNHCIVVYVKEIAVACGAMKEFNNDCLEIKRMYTLKKERGKGYASLVLYELETWAKELGYTYCILETGKRQPEAIGLYKSRGYEFIPNYGQYKGIDNSVCFRKSLN